MKRHHLLYLGPNPLDLFEGIRSLRALKKNQRKAAMPLPNAFGKMFHPKGYPEHPSLMDFSYLTDPSPNNAKKPYINKTDSNRRLGKIWIKKNNNNK